MSSSSQCSITGVTKTMVCAILSVGCALKRSFAVTQKEKLMNWRLWVSTLIICVVLNPMFNAIKASIKIKDISFSFFKWIYNSSHSWVNTSYNRDQWIYNSSHSWVNTSYNRDKCIYNSSHSWVNTNYNVHPHNMYD